MSHSAFSLSLLQVFQDTESNRQAWKDSVKSKGGKPLQHKHEAKVGRTSTTTACTFVWPGPAAVGFYNFSLFSSQQL